MTKEQYESLAFSDLKEIGKTRGMKSISSMKKAELIQAMLALDEKEARDRSEEEAAKKAEDAAEQRPQARTAEPRRRERRGESTYGFLRAVTSGISF